MELCGGGYAVNLDELIFVHTLGVDVDGRGEKYSKLGDRSARHLHVSNHFINVRQRVQLRPS